MPGDEQGREGDETDPAPFLESTDDLAHEDEYGHTSDGEAADCACFVASRFSGTQVAADGKTHESNGREHADPVEGDGRTRIAADQDHDHRCNDEGRQHGAREVPIRRAVHETYRQYATDPIPVRSGLDVFISCHVRKR